MPSEARPSAEEPRATRREELDYFRSGQHRLFGAFFPPRGVANGKGVVFCNAFGKEFDICRTPVVRFARELADVGYAAARFDYAGYGDSEGSFEGSTITSMQADVGAAIDELARRAPWLREIVLVGVRFGAIPATLEAARRPEVTRLLLWAPVLDARTLLGQGLRQTVAAQTLLFGEIRFTREQLVANVMRGAASEADGYDMNVIDDGFPLGRALLDEAKVHDLVARPPPLRARTLALHVTTKDEPVPVALQAFAASVRAGGAACEARVAVEPVPFWMHGGMFVQRLPEVFAASTRWLEG